MRPSLRACVVALVLASWTLVSAQLAAAGNVMFNGNLIRRSNATQIITMATNPGATLMTTPASPAGFTIPANAFSGMFAFSSTSPQYPFFAGDVSVMNGQAGPFAANALTNTVTINFSAPAQYPFLSLSPPAGFMRLRPGPNGFGGPMPIHRNDAYTALALASTGLYDVDVQVDYDYGNAIGSSDVSGSYAWWSAGQHTFLTTGGSAMAPIQFGQVGGGRGAIAFTGTATVSAPLGTAEYEIHTAMDNRNAAGTMGTIQLVTPRVTYGYSVAQIPPPLDGTATLVSLNNDYSTAAIAELTFLPEPGQLAMLGSGILALCGASRMRRRA